MRAKKYLGIAILISACLGLSGCGESFPDLTEEEYDQTVEFAVGLLMKYSNNGQNKLTYVDAKELNKQREKEAAQKAKEEQEKAKEPEKVTPEPEPVVVPPVQDETTSGSSEDEATTALSGQEPGDSSSLASSGEGPGQDEGNTDTSEPVEVAKEDPDAIVISADDTYEITDDIFLSYDGYSVSSSYPESSKSYVINADKGKKLLVLRFDLYNASDSSKNVDLLKKNILIQVILNGKNLGYTPVTFLPNDLTSYVGTIDSRAHESLVVLTEIDQSVSTQIQTLGLIVTMNGAEQKVTLK